ncbi:MAG: F-type H+-transporting ATPase subunit epsilon, partial [Alphaproteobacteria bacterium]|nr:F-type H+-transporting ATPase subunit epsilon [Alphaproteobacteria bacterium]
MATFHFDLVAPDKLLFSGEVDQVDVPGAEGDFGVLAGHAPLVATLKPGILVVHEGGQKKRIVVTGGFAEVNPQGLTILADVATAVEDIDRTAITAQIREIEESVKEMEQGTALDRAIARLDHFKALDTHLQGTAM